MKLIFSFRTKLSNLINPPFFFSIFFSNSVLAAEGNTLTKRDLPLCRFQTPSSWMQSVVMERIIFSKDLVLKNM